jgi:ankyrin repeat protein
MKSFLFISVLARCNLLAVVFGLVAYSIRSASAQVTDVNAAMLIANHGGDFARVQVWLDSGADPNARDGRGRTALMAALSEKRANAADFWERQKIDVNARDRNGATLLMYAAGAGNPDLVAFLLNHGAQVNARDRRGRSALVMTVAWSNYDVKTSEDSYVDAAGRLLAHGADINARVWTGWTALFYAVESGHQQLCQLLLRHGADVNLRDRSGCTALAMAVSQGSDTEIVRMLRQHGARIGLIEAILLQDHAAIQQLLRGKLDDKERAPFGETPLMLAAEEGDPALVRALLAKGANPNERRYDGVTALMLAFTRRQWYTWPYGYATQVNAEDAVRLPIVDALLKAGARVNVRDRQKQTPLFWALRFSTPAIVRRLLDAGADVNARDRQGGTPLMAARRTVGGLHEGVDSAPALYNRIRPWDAEKELVEMLLARGAAINAQDHRGNTILHQISLDMALLNLLVEHGADVNRRNRQGQTALMQCAQHPDDLEGTLVKLAQRLLEAGADASARDRYGNTALTYAIWAEYRPIEDFLRSKGLKEGLMDVVLRRDSSNVHKMLAAGANPNVKMDNDETALIVAAEHGDIEIAQDLLAHGADIRALFFDGTALTRAAENGDAAMMRLLLAHGADANAINNPGYSVLLMAVRGDNSDSLESSMDAIAQERPYRLELVQALLERGARVDAASSNGVTPLMMAAALGNTEIVRTLLAHGANPNVADNAGNTPLMLAQERNHADIVALLRQAGAWE